MLDMNKLDTEWYDWTLKGGPKPEFLKQRVAYYLAGAEEWKYSDRLDSISNMTRRLYLNSSLGSANDVFHSGRLEETPPAEAQPDQTIYDPLDVRPADLEREEIKNFITDQRYALNLFGNGLVYHSVPLEVDTEITGFLKLVAWIALDVPDTDFQAYVYEILQDGSSIILTKDWLRARYRESLRQEKLVTVGEINRYEFDGFTFFSRRIARGSRLRLLISSPREGNVRTGIPQLKQIASILLISERVALGIQIKTSSTSLFLTSLSSSWINPTTGTLQIVVPCLRESSSTIATG